jgi:hypothetical protein
VAQTSLRELTRDFEALAEAFAQEHPERVAELAASVPAGEMRMGLLMARARELLESDAEAAIAMAREEEAPRTQRAMLAMIGAKLAYEDPAAALALLEEALAGGGLEYRTTVRHSGGASSSGGSAPGTHTWLEGLAQSHARETMALLEDREESRFFGGLVTTFSRHWVEADVDGFDEWLGRQERGVRRDMLIGQVTQSLISGDDPDFVRAVEWAATTGNEVRSRMTIKNWRERNAEEAAEYFASGAAPEVAANVYRALVEEEGKR